MDFKICINNNMKFYSSYFHSQVLHEVYFKLDHLIGKSELRDFCCAVQKNI